MSEKTGKPCKKCGAQEWNEGGNCKACSREYSRRWREANREKHNEFSRRWREANRERDSENARHWREANRERVSENSRRWQQANPDRTRENIRRWKRSNPERVIASKHRRRARKTQAGGSFTATEWRDLCNYYGNKCLCCGRSDLPLTVDHVLPVVMGGSSNLDNLQPLCKPCNSRKQDKHIDYRNRPTLLRWVQRALFD